MFHASEIPERMNWPIISIRNFWAALNRPTYLPDTNEATRRVQAEASFEAAEEAGAEQGARTVPCLRDGPAGSAGVDFVYDACCGCFRARPWNLSDDDRDDGPNQMVRLTRA